MSGAAPLRARLASPEDGAAIVALFQEDGNPHGWSVERWRHAYLAYPEGAPVVVLLEAGDRVVGHYGMLPVTVGEHRAMLGLHAHVSTPMRGLAAISRLMRAVDETCLERGVPFLCGFSNPGFTEVKTRLFKWRVAAWLGFEEVTAFDPAEHVGRPLGFRYSDRWPAWRFGGGEAPFLSVYDDGERRRVQLLHSGGRRVERAGGFECWHPRAYAAERPAAFAQPLCVKRYDADLGDDLLFRPESWLVEMGDSDTFVHTPLEEQERGR